MIDGGTYMAEAQSERQFGDNVVTFAKARGWLVYHTFDSRRSPAGFPDLVCVRDGRLVFAELKREKPAKCSPSMARKLDPTPAQLAWLTALGDVGTVPGGRPSQRPIVGAYLWRPSSWPEIEKVLT